MDLLGAVSWSEKVHHHNSSEGSRANVQKLVADYQDGEHLYVCGPDVYMQAVMQVALEAHWPEEAVHAEYFTVPELPDYVNHGFTLQLSRSGRVVEVSATQSATDALADAGVHVDVKCSDGLCGVCRCGVLDGDVQHRDFVLSTEQRKSSMILCQSRAAQEDGVIKIDL